MVFSVINWHPGRLWFFFIGVLRNMRSIIFVDSMRLNSSKPSVFATEKNYRIKPRIFRLSKTNSPALPEISSHRKARSSIDNTTQPSFFVA